MESLWRKQAKPIKAKSSRSMETVISEDTHWDVIVVGAGMAGILTAYYLQEQGKRVLVLEAAEIASGQTERTTAKITSQHDVKYSKLIKKVGRRKAQMYARANEAAIREYERIVCKERIDCQFERVPAYLYTLQDAKLLRQEAEAAASLGIDSFFTTETELPFPVTGAVCFRRQAQFSPLEFIKHIAAKLEIWEHTKVVKVKGDKVVIEYRNISKDASGKSKERTPDIRQITLTADKIVIATHYPVLNAPGFYFLRQHQERSYVLALSGIIGKADSGCDEMKGMYYGVDKGGFSFRRAGDVLLFGGGSHRTGENICGGVYDSLAEASKQYFPKCKEVARWSAQDCMPHDGIPFIGKYSFFTPNRYVVTGFQKWGMTTSMVAAMILQDELCGRKNPYARVFSPQRLNIRAGIGKLLVDVGISIKGLVKGLLHKPVRCPHLGCELTWNPDEKSWDCPCHGSRFDVEGKLLDNPAKKEVKQAL